MRPWQVGAIFGLCLAVVLAALGWISLATLRLDREQSLARRQAALEENTRLALWRAESAVLLRLVTPESARPYFWFTSFYPAERAYPNMFNTVSNDEALLASPLMTESSPYVLLHFQIGPDGRLTSPQAPSGAMAQLAERSLVSHEKIETARRRLAALEKLAEPRLLAEALPPEESPLDNAKAYIVSNVESNQAAQNAQREDPQSQRTLNIAEFQSRTRVTQQQAFDNRNLAVPADNQPATAGLARQVREGALKALWLGDELVLVRRVTIGPQRYIQGCLLDWPAISFALSREISDLLPQGRFVPVRGAESQDEARLLASLPVRLVPGPMPVERASGLTPIDLSLLVAWGAALLAAVACAVLLYGTVALSERRAAFVSAVTHELRTPLTTFRLYSEMLAENMVTEADKRQRYLNTLRAEAERLTHLVENVLAYSRLERQRRGGRPEIVTLDELLRRAGERLGLRARQSEMTLRLEPAAPGVGQCRVRADVAAVEQILFNLVDNACKYAARAADRTIHLELDCRGRQAFIRVRDHGPGIAPPQTRRLFQPFSKSAHEAANSAPGVGLGLALCRRLARQMQGDLRLETSVGNGQVTAAAESAYGSSTPTATPEVPPASTPGACLALVLPTAV